MGALTRAIEVVCRKLKTQNLFSSVAALGSGAVAAQLLSAVGIVWTARLFAPAAFGLLALFTAVSLFFLPVVSGRYENAVMIPESDSEAAAIAGLSCAIALVSCSCFAVGALMFSSRCAVYLGLPASRVPLWTVGASLNLFVWAVNQVASYW